MRAVLERVLSALFWILLWAVAARLMNNALLVSSPLETFRTMCNMVLQGDFWKTVLSTFLRMLGGFGAALVLAFSLAALSSKIRLVRILAETPRAFTASVPLAAFVILALFWFGPEKLSFVISALVAFPILYSALLTGMMQDVTGARQAADMYHVSVLDRMRHVRWPVLWPFLLSSAGVAMRMCWRSTVAAELITQVGHSIGFELYHAKIYLETAELFSWMVLLILFGNVSEWILKLLMSLCGPGAFFGQRIGRGREKMSFVPSGEIPLVELEHVTADYQSDQTVLEVFSGEGVSLSAGGGDRIAVMGPSGVGKTTLLSVIAGQMECKGSRLVRGKCFMNFSEDRLAEHLSGRKNLLMCGFSEEEAERELNNLGISDADQNRPAKDYSKGMKRRLSLARAVLGLKREGSGILLLDEPFSGLDEGSRKMAVKELSNTLTQMGERAVLILVTHEKEEADALGAADDCRLDFF